MGNLPEFYNKALKSYRWTSLKEDIQLIKRYRKGDKKAGDFLVVNNLGLILLLGNKYLSHFNIEDIVSEGHMALLFALRKYDPRYKVKFGTYASRWIRARLAMMSNRAKSLVNRNIHNSNVPTDRSLNVPLAAGADTTYQDMLTDDLAPIDEQCITAEIKKSVHDAIQKLPDNYAFVLSEIYLKGASAPSLINSPEVGGKCGTRATIHNRLNTAKATFKSVYLEDHPDYAEELESA